MINVALCSKHEKAAVVAPILEAIGYRVYETDGFDTDTLGTFSGEVERVLTPLQAALKKAKEACRLTGEDYGLGSEGSFGGGPLAGIVNWNEEVLCLYRDSTGQAVYARASGSTGIQNIKATMLEDLLDKCGQFPGQRWILRSDQQLLKGLRTEQLASVLEENAIAMPVELEPDLRAMFCPERQTMIAKATDNLVERLQSHCPECDAPDFVVKDVETGLPCGLCRMPTEQVLKTIKLCEPCGMREELRVDTPFGDPTYCQFCNP